MASSTNQAPESSAESVQEYFKKLSTNYSRQTGESTYQFIKQVLQKLPPSVAPSTSSVIHDNACGPGTAATAVIASIGSEPSLIEATDSNAAMVDALSQQIAAANWKNVKASVTDSHELSFPDDNFTMSITNFSVSNFRDPLTCLQHVYRTLKPGGLAVVSTWKRFTVADIIHAAQLAVRADAQLVRIPGQAFMKEGSLRDVMLEAGFTSNVEVWDISTTVRGEDIEGIREFMLGGILASARAGWTDEEQAKWQPAIDNTIEQEKTKNGGIRMDAWVVTAVK